VPETTDPGKSLPAATARRPWRALSARRVRWGARAAGSAGCHRFFGRATYGFHCRGVTASGVPFFSEPTQPAAVSLNLLKYRIRLAMTAANDQHHVLVDWSRVDRLPSELFPRTRCPPARALCAGTSYWITLSAVANSVWGMVSPRVLAVLRLMTNSSLVALVTDRSPGFWPLRMRPT